MTLVEHLAELRRRLFIALVAIAVGAVLAFIAYNRILAVLREPLCDFARRHENTSCRFLVTSPLDPFAIRLQIATYAGFVIASPVVFWQLWRFVAPGLHAHEKRYAVSFIISSIVLFAAGASLAYITAPKALDFLLQIGGSQLDVRLNPTRYLTLITLMIVAFGVSFEFPVFLVFLLLVGALSTRSLRRWRRYAAVGITIFAAVITPSQDPYTMLGMAVPMYLFYEASILIGRALRR
ncbi:MAG: twin-arginine translocase subunit TatC [Acidimicrobiia bacterium]